MNWDEFAFLNRQLAGMLKSGIPLEGALNQLCRDLDRGRWQAEFEAIRNDLEKGLSLDQSLADRALPDFYKRMIQLGIRGNDLPSALLGVADHYQRMHLLWVRLQGLLVYPLIVLFAAQPMRTGVRKRSFDWIRFMD